MNITNATTRAVLSKPTTESPSAANTTGTDLSILNTSTTSALNSTDASSILKDHTPLIVQLFLVSLVFLLAVIGNAGIWVLLKRFRSLRTVPNILVGNLALIDFLNATVNLPVFTAAGVLQLGHMGGRLASATIFAGQTLVIFLHLLSMLLMMVDRYIAIAWGLHYRIWKSQRKVSTLMVVDSYIAMTAQETISPTNTTSLYQQYKKPLPCGYITYQYNQPEPSGYITYQYNQPEPSGYITYQYRQPLPSGYITYQYNQPLPSGYITYQYNQREPSGYITYQYNQPLPSGYITYKYHQPLPSGYIT
ncbi:predicted protein [Nematostella vectensis]|uniref:G-protein coupled receptors family 1 profile domain-containing protein n=1 Tax=Nematostella vectensis TaxID=45351 RepID=A7T3N4_NEMVE|nr:predicted protein [Nematostella vectensis]|eukprot:XP_001621531.1 hypothetical protein NEMVEDRAFT_v1g221882 [Nematostella vectensis]